MRKNISLLCLTGLLLAMYGCKKDSSNNPSSTNAALTGKWLTTKERTRVYSTAGALLKDSTHIFANDLISNAWFETYTKNGTGAVITNQGDTSLTYTYKISGSALTIYEFGDPGEPQVSKIMSVNGASMELETSYTSTPSSGWGLDLGTNYNFVEDDYYTRQ